MLRNHHGQTLEEMLSIQVMSMVQLLEMLAGTNIRCLLSCGGVLWTWTSVPAEETFHQ